MVFAQQSLQKPWQRFLKEATVAANAQENIASCRLGREKHIFAVIRRIQHKAVEEAYMHQAIV